MVSRREERVAVEKSPLHQELCFAARFGQLLVISPVLRQLLLLLSNVVQRKAAQTSGGKYLG